MQVVELVVQGIKQFPEQRRIGLGAGNNALLDAKDPSGARLAILADAVRGLLTFDPARSYAERVVDPAAPASRVGATIKGRDGATYRLIHDLKSGAYALHRARPDGSNAFDLVSSNPQEVAQLLKTQLGLPPTDAFVKIFASPAAELPSRRAAPMGMVPGMTGMMTMMPGMVPGMVPGMTGMMTMMPGMMPGMAPGMPGMPGAPQPPQPGKLNFAHLSTAEKQQRLAAVKGALKNLKVQQELEFELDGVQRRRFELEEALRPLKGVETAVAEAAEALRVFEHLEKLPPDVLRQLDLYEKQLHALHDDFKKADEEARNALTRAHNLEIPPVYKDKVFLGGLGGTVVALLVAVGGAMASGPGWRYFAFLHLVGLGAVAYSLLQYINLLEERSDLQGNAKGAAEKKEKAQRRFDLDTSNTRRILAEFDIKDAKELDAFRDQVLQRDEKRRILEEKQRELEAAQAAIGPGAKPEEFAALMSRQADLEAKLQSMGFSGNERDLLEEEKQLEAELGGEAGGAGGTLGYDRGYGGPVTSGGGVGGGRLSGYHGDDDEAPYAMVDPDGHGEPRWAVGSGGPPTGGFPAPGMPGGFGFPPGFAGPPGGGADAVVQMMKAALDLFHLPMEQVGTLLQPRTSQYLTALSDRRYASVTFTDTGDLAAIDAAGKPTPFATMSPQDQDLAYLSVKMTIIETFGRKQPTPAVMDSWFATIPDVKHPLLAKMIQFLGSICQVVHFCPKPTLAEGADPSIQL
ncbi:MAG: ABC transporter C-terminal domain-containing protein [Myxococcota bacterium]